MRIGLVLPNIPAYSETFFLNKIKGLESSGHSVILFVNASKKFEFNTCKVKVAPKLTGSFIHVGFKSAYLLIVAYIFHFNKNRRLYLLDKEDGVAFFQRIKNCISNSHITSESLDWLHFGFATMVIHKENVAKALGAKMAVSFRGFDIGVYPLKYPGCYHKLWDKVDKIHVISDDIHKLLFMQGFQEQVEVVKITPAIDTDYFKAGEKKVSAAHHNFITVARLHWKKGLEYTLEALALLKKEGIHFTYTVIGEGKDYERLKFAAYQLDLADRVIFRGKIAHELIKEELGNADVYIQYSIQEGFCNAVLEAQALGLLCVVSDAEGLSENVLTNETGWVVPKGNARALANKLMEVLHLEQSEKNRISSNAQRRVKAHFSTDQQRLKFIQFYSE